MTAMDTHNPGEQKRYPSTEDNYLKYLLYLPPAFNDSSEKQWPVLCFLHGGGEAAKNKAEEDQPIEALMNHGSPAWRDQFAADPGFYCPYAATSHSSKMESTGLRAGGKNPANDLQEFPRRPA